MESHRNHLQCFWARKVLRFFNAWFRIPRPCIKHVSCVHITNTQKSQDSFVREKIRRSYGALYPLMQAMTTNRTFFPLRGVRKSRSLKRTLPTIIGELGGMNHMLWVTTAHVLASTIVIPHDASQSGKLIEEQMINRDYRHCRLPPVVENFLTKSRRRRNAR